MRISCLLLLPFLLTPEAEARLPDPATTHLEFRSTLGLKNRSALNIPELNICQTKQIMGGLQALHGRQSSSCGALPKIWEEASEHLIRITSGTFLGFRVNSDPNDSCQTTERLRLYDNALGSLKTVDDAAEREYKRIRDLCSEEREDFRRFVSSVQRLCTGSLAIRGFDQQARGMEEDIIDTCINIYS